MTPPLLDDAARAWCASQFARQLGRSNMSPRFDGSRSYDKLVGPADHRGLVNLYFSVYPIETVTYLACDAYVFDANGRPVAGFDNEIAQLREELLLINEVANADGFIENGTILIPLPR